MADKSFARQHLICLAWQERRLLRRLHDGESAYMLGYYHGLLTALRTMRRRKA
jgi:hypothetical protein